MSVNNRDEIFYLTLVDKTNTPDLCVIKLYKQDKKSKLKELFIDFSSFAYLFVFWYLVFKLITPFIGIKF